eukprot:NODE_8871_length_497_cov_40.024554_g7801_i0.p3 GENE.NODE_8871_length_497_cov_40.024554_g7801_i0~~NODE_8871_length_497_cov_40.024554_g7801_i0.p3  ORF type:complete len:58 (-),score=3.72 NODE_8871_length_497_cov_40.024554_g7801_i0:124-297(-)
MPQPGIVRAAKEREVDHFEHDLQLWTPLAWSRNMNSTCEKKKLKMVRDVATIQEILS